MKILLTLSVVAFVAMALYSNRPVILVEEQATEAPTQHAEAPVPAEKDIVVLEATNFSIEE